MYELIDSMIKAMEKDAVVSKNKPKTAQSLRRAITELAAHENAKVPAERRVTLRDVETVAARSLNKTAGLERSSRFFAAYKDVASFIVLATTGNTPTRITSNRDLLPVGHPLSTRGHAMTASAYSQAVARWIAADPRIHDEARSLVAAVYSLAPGSLEYAHAVTRLQSLEAGMVPRDMLVFSDISPITAAGFLRWLAGKFGGGNSSIARSLRAKAQLRDRKGRFAEQGGGLQFYARTGDGTIKSKVGRHAGNAENGTDFLVEISGDADLADGIYAVPANITEAVKAIIPGDDAGGVTLPEGVDAVDVASLQRKDMPDGWKLIKEKAEGESGPDKIYAADDGYEVEVYNPGNFDKSELQKAYQFNKGLQGEVPGMPVGQFTERIDALGRPNMQSKFDPKQPLYIVYRVETPETKRQAVVMAQRWSDVQEKTEADQDKFEKYFDAAEKANADKKVKQDEALEKSKANQEAFEKKAAEVAKQNEQTRAEVEANLAKGLDPFGNKIPDGWVAAKNDDALNPGYSMKIGDKEYVTTPIKKEDAVAYERTEQGYTGNLRHTPDGGLKGLYQNQEFKNWDDAQVGFAETVEADVDARRETVLDAVEPYDESGEIREMIENGANGDEVLEKLRENEKWKTREEDYDTRGFVDLPSKSQKADWAEFGKNLERIKNLPPEFTPFDTEVKATLPEPEKKNTKLARELKVGDKVIHEGKVKTVTKKFSMDSGDRITFDDGTFEIYDDGDSVDLAPEAPATPEPEQKVEKPAAPEPKAAQPSDIEWNLPDGAYNLYKADEYEPEGRQDQESPDYTDDPKVLANKFSPDQLKDALAQAIIGVKDYATEFLDEFFDDLEDEEEGDVKKKPGPKKKKPKAKQASGYGQLDFAYGEEYVPAEAIYVALKEQGEDAEMLAAELYDLPLGEPKNVDMLEGLRTPEEIKAQEPSTILDDFDKDAMDIAETNIAVAQGDAAATAVGQMNEVIENGEQNVYIRDLATDLNSTGVQSSMQGMLDKYIALAVSDNEDENQAYQALHSVLLSADGGLTIPGEETMLFEAVGNALQKYNGSEATVEDIDAIFEKYGYYKDLVLSKRAVAEGDESINDKSSKAGALYRLVVAGGKANAKPLYRGIQVSLDSEAFEKYTTEGGIVSLDARSFADYPQMAEKFAGAFTKGNNDKASVIFTMPAGLGKALDITKVSPFGDERESLGFGNYRIAKLKIEKDPNSGKTLVIVRLEALDKRSELLEGMRDDYNNVLLENETIELPESYYTPQTDPYENMDVEAAQNEKELEAIQAADPLYIARAYEMEDLLGAFRGAIEDGTGKVQLLDDENEYSVDVEAVRDALQIQGINTNAVLQDIANAEPDVEADEVDEEPVEPVADSLLEQIITEFGQEYDLEGLEQIAPQQGSNPGGKYKDADGNEYYVKQPKSELHRRNELLASAFYKLAGVNAAEMRFGSANDGVEKVLSSIIPGDLLADVDLAPGTKKQIQEGFAIDAWLANWDVAGLVNDNIIINDGDAYRIDAGGALLFRAMGAPKGKAFGNEVTELDTLRNTKMNPTSAALFGDMAEEDLRASASKLLDISHTDIDNLVDATMGSLTSDEGLVDDLKNVLKARRNYILERFGLLGDDTSLIAETAKVEEPEIGDVENYVVDFDRLGAGDMFEDVPGLEDVDAADMDEEEALQKWLDAYGLDKLGVKVVTIIDDDLSPRVQFEIPVNAKDAFGEAYGMELDENLGQGVDKVEASAPKTVEEPAPTSTESVTNPYVTSDGTPIEPGMKLKYKKTDEVVDFIKYDKGNSSYVYVKMADGSIKVKSTKQLKSIKDEGDDDNGGPGGEEPSPEPETPSAPETTPEPTPSSDVTVINTTGSVEDAVDQIKKAIEENQTISFFYNGKARTFKPMSIWENQKNGKINVYGEDLGDEGKKKNFTVQLMENYTGVTNTESVEAEKPTVETPQKKLQLHAQWIKDLLAQKGTIISDEKAVEIRDAIDANTDIDWSQADDADIISAITDVVGPGVVDIDEESTVEPETTSEQVAPVAEAPDTAETTQEAPALEPGAEVTDKKGNKGTVLKGPNKDNYVFVKFEDGKTGWRSAASVSTTGEFDNTVKKAAPKKVTGKVTPAGTKAVFVENPAGWDTSDFENVPALTDAIALVQNPDDKSAAMKGASAAVDADSIEDLDVRIMRVRDVEGNDGIRLKFKLTAWAGNARVKEIMDMTPEQLKAASISKDSMTVDRIDVGPDGVGQVSKLKNAYQGEGVTWTIKTPDGIVVKLYRGNYDATSKLSPGKYGSPRAFHNMVQIQAPADATNEQLAEAMKLAGVSDVRPATQADARILVENRLMSIFDGKVDATKNPKGADREASLQRVKDKYGITPDDVTITTGASGRIETRLSPEGAKKIVDATGGPSAIQHTISVPGFYGNDEAGDKRTEWITNLLATPQGGLLSTTTRWTEGIGTSGMSSAADVGTGGADYVFTKPVKVADAKTYGTSGVVMYFDPVKVYQRLDFYANSYDAFGKRMANQDVINAAKVGAYELMWKHRLSFDDLDSIVVNNQATRTAVIQKLRQMGITEIGGRPLEAVIIIGSNLEEKLKSYETKD